MEPVLAELCHRDALPGAHRPTAADTHPGPPSRPRTGRPPACPRNTGAWLRPPPSPHQIAVFRQRRPPAPGERPGHGRAQGEERSSTISGRPATGLRSSSLCACVAEVCVGDVNTGRRKCGLRSCKGSSPSGGWARLPGEGGVCPGPGKWGLLCVRGLPFVLTAVSTDSSLWRLCGRVRARPAAGSSSPRPAVELLGKSKDARLRWNRRNRTVFGF